MSNEIDWSKAPEGYPIWIQDLSTADGFDGSGWHKNEGDKYIDINDDYWTKPEEGFYKVHFPPKAWNGHGLPPVGTVCEFYDRSLSEHWPEELENGDKVKVLAHYSPLEDGDMVAVFCYEVEGGRLTDQAVACCFRPVRTPEQIAAEDRENAIKEIEDLIAGYSYGKCAEILYQSGYRRTKTCDPSGFED